MKVLKFGGTSVGSRPRIQKVLEILENGFQWRNCRVAVFSAVGGTTDDLVALGQKAAEGDSKYLKLFQEISERHLGLCRELLPENKEVLERVEELLQELNSLLGGVYLLKEVSPRTQDLLMSFGERFSITIIAAAAQKAGLPAVALDAREVVRTNSDFGRAVVELDITFERIQERCEGKERLFIVSGFIAATKRDETTTLGRGGSDYTAALFAGALSAECLEIWTDVSGVMTADPRKVSKAFVVDAMTYQEAMEMSHFGARVLHPPTLAPALKKKIPLQIKNTFESEAPGTTIASKVEKNGHWVKGISSMDRVSLLCVEGGGMVGISGISMRLFGVLAREDISVILITQASSEHSICLAIPPQYAERAKDLVEAEFALEMQVGHVERVRLEGGLSIVALVGQAMFGRPGVAGRMFSALGSNGVNVRAIAQGSSELNISAVVDAKDEVKALNALHDAFFLSDSRTVNLFLLGPGLIGKTLLKQISDQREYLLKSLSLDLRVVALANSKCIHFDERGVELESWEEVFSRAGVEASLPAFVEHMQRLNLPNSVFVDCSASDEPAKFYGDILRSAIAIATPNKKANSSRYSDYEELQKICSRRGVKFIYEANVGAGLPVLGTLRGLQRSGDRVHRIEAVLSGTLSYIFNSYDGSCGFSEVVWDAQEKGFTEPDPREDLNGMDVGRKLLILAREAGLRLEPEDVEVENLLPATCQGDMSLSEFREKLSAGDAAFTERLDAAKAEGKVLRYMAVLEAGKAEVGLKAVGPDSPFYSLEGSDNLVSFTTDRYQEQALLVKGPGAGAQVTAGQVFADIIRIFQE